MSMLTYTFYSKEYKGDQTVIITLPKDSTKAPYPAIYLIGKEGTQYNEWVRHTRLETYLEQQAVPFATVSLASQRGDKILNAFMLHEIPFLLSRLFPLSTEKRFLLDARSEPMWLTDPKETAAMFLQTQGTDCDLVVALNAFAKKACE